MPNEPRKTDAEVAALCGISTGEAILARLVDTLSSAERRELRAALEANGMKTLPRNLFFNYETQEWI